MEQKISKKYSYAVLVLALAIGVVAVATSNSLVSAQSCTAQLGAPIVSPLQYYGANVQVTIPVSSTCSFYPGQLYATGTASSSVYGVNIGTANTALTQAYGGYASTGDLSFTVPTSAQYQPVQFTVSIYNTQNGYLGGYGYYGGALLAQASQTFLIGPNYYQSYPAYSGYPTYPSYQAPSYTYPSYQTPSYTYPSYQAPGYPSYPSTYYYSPRYSQYPYGYYYMGGYYNYYHR